MGGGGGGGGGGFSALLFCLQYSGVVGVGFLDFWQLSIKPLSEVESVLKPGAIMDLGFQPLG